MAESPIALERHYTVLDRMLVKFSLNNISMLSRIDLASRLPAISRRFPTDKGVPAPGLKRGMQNSYAVHGDVVVIYLGRRTGPSLEALIDTTDLETVKRYTGRFYAMWSEDSRTFYCVGHKKNEPSTLLHRLIMAPSDKQEVDHCDHDGLDNRRALLKVVTRSENALNRRRARVGSKSGVRGVYWHKKSNSWRVQVRAANGARKELSGGFRSVSEAAESREEWARTQGAG